MRKCPICQAAIVEGAHFCHMCGIPLKNAQEELDRRMRAGELPLYRHTFQVQGVQKAIEVWCHDLTKFPQFFDLLTISAYMDSYNIKSKSVIGALWKNFRLDVGKLLDAPYIDLRPYVGCWLSKEIADSSAGSHFGRIGCISLSGKNAETGHVMCRLKSYFHMLDLAADAGIAMETIAMPIIGTGVQKIKTDTILLPLMNEVIAMMRRNNSVKKVLFVEYDWNKANETAELLRQSYQLSYGSEEPKGKKATEPYFFISYTTHGDTYVAEALRDELKRRGIRCWYAPDSIRSGDYASKIVEAIRECTHFVCIISKNANSSFHVVNELDLAFNRLNDGITILPFVLDNNVSLNDSFSYYISRMQWNYGYPDPVKDRVNEFLDKVCEGL